MTLEEQQRINAFSTELQALGQRYGVDITAGVKRRIIRVDNGDGRGDQVHEESWVEIEFMPVQGWQATNGAVTPRVTAP